MVATNNCIAVQNTQLTIISLHTPDQVHTLTEIPRLQHSTPPLPLTCLIARARMVPASTYVQWSEGANWITLLNRKQEIVLVSAEYWKKPCLEILFNMICPLQQIYKDRVIHYSLPFYLCSLRKCKAVRVLENQYKDQFILVIIIWKVSQLAVSSGK